MRPLPDRPRGLNPGDEESDAESTADEDEPSVDTEGERWLATQDF